MTNEETLEEKVARVDNILSVEERYSQMDDELKRKDAEIKRLQQEVNGLKGKEYRFNLGKKISSVAQSIAPIIVALGIGIGVLYGGYKGVSAGLGYMESSMANSEQERQQEAKARQEQINRENKVRQEKYDTDLKKIMYTDFETMKRLFTSFSNAFVGEDRELLKEFFQCHYSFTNNSEYNMMETVVDKKFKERKSLLSIFGVSYALQGNPDSPFKLNSPTRDYSVLIKVSMGSSEGKQIDIEGRTQVLCNNQQCYFVLIKKDVDHCPDYVGVIE